MGHFLRLWTLAFIGTLLPPAPVSAEIRVMTSGAFAAAHLELSPRFAKAAQETIVTVTTSTGVGAESIPNRLRRSEAADVVILPDDALNQLIKDGLIVAGSRVALARSEIGMAVRAGAPKPDISSVDALRNTLLQAKSVAYSASVSGVYLATELFPKLGIAAQMKSKSLRIERERVGAVVARGEAEIGFQQITELLEIKGIDYVGPLPPEVQRVTLISAGVAVNGKNPEGARRLIQFFASPDAAADLRKVGLQPLVPPWGRSSSIAASALCRSCRATCRRLPREPGRSAGAPEHLHPALRDGGKAGRQLVRAQAGRMIVDVRHDDQLVSPSALDKSRHPLRDSLRCADE